MTGTEWFLFLAGLVAFAAGLALLYTCWKNRNAPKGLIAGWALIFAACVLTGFGNTDRGIAQGIVVLMLLAGAFFALPLFKGLTAPVPTSERKAANQPETTIFARLKIIGGSVWTFILSGPVAGVIAMFGAAVYFRLAKPESASPATAGVTAIMLAVFGWAVISTLLLIEPRPLRRTLYAVAGLLATGVAAFI